MSEPSGTEQSFNEANIAEFRANSGKVGGQFEGFPLMLLTSVGAKSGAERVNPLAYFDIDGKAYIVGSSAGRPKNPAWVANLRANPHVEVEIGANPKASAIAVELPRAERDRVFEIVKQRAPGFAEYEAATDRVIPVFEIRLA
ncbi:nitroreductase family deazaflavin-dependent oxidoreductase [Mycobacteroides abscessus]|uniref:nitroreductase family deazaflavin-dependent oxidoreductase n=1 Tax=Mycobacteroides abscessus TaxID=36809 RepID=UPI00078BF312|nr:nitroreductase family deazaflavin-dependent oxidoreductase [Mycobacteroides abscessus]AMU23784.1 deazaflavin-dependent nitroreductase [Mycobacteroides abscessus]SHZ02769.1 deazaflavin-dependent nitroreductase family protein [Mycobacteroides abscessus subsp. bolletii]SHZ27851.1 deazaflavin-dependent nitroreductase family protein [Mycobacteroides abscessus subsp. bolletii]